MDSNFLISSLAGFGVGVFLAIGSAVILKRTLYVMEAKNMQWGMANAAGLASLWIAKIAVACVLLFAAQRAGFSTAALGMSLPVGIIGGIFISKKFIRPMQ